MSECIRTYAIHIELPCVRMLSILATVPNALRAGVLRLQLNIFPSLHQKISNIHIFIVAYWRVFCHLLAVFFIRMHELPWWLFVFDDCNFALRSSGTYSFDGFMVRSDYKPRSNCDWFYGTIPDKRSEQVGNIGYRSVLEVCWSQSRPIPISWSGERITHHSL